jgi:hypothetical protein
MLGGGIFVTEPILQPGPVPHPDYVSIGSSEPYSFHLGGANFCMGDESVRWLNDSIDIREFARLVKRNGAELAPEQQ